MTINWGEPERAPHKRYSCARIVYIYILSWYIRHAKFMTCMHGSMDINAKYSFAHSHDWAYADIRCSNLANCKFALVPWRAVRIERDKACCQPSSVRGAAKKAIDRRAAHWDCTTEAAMWLSYETIKEAQYAAAILIASNPGSLRVRGYYFDCWQRLWIDTTCTWMGLSAGTPGNYDSHGLLGSSLVPSPLHARARGLGMRLAWICVNGLHNLSSGSPQTGPAWH